MWRVAVSCAVLALTALLTACSASIPGLIAPTPLSAIPPVKSNPVAQATASSGPTLAGNAPPTLLVNIEGTYTPIPRFTATTSRETATAVGTVTMAPESAQPTEGPASAESISLDKLPADTVYKRVRIENQSHRQMDVSLHCTTLHGLHTVLEYQNVKNLSVEAPEGDYVFVIYVGGRQRSGTFSLLSVPNVTVTVYTDRVVIH